MQIQLVSENIEMKEDQTFEDSSLICLKSFSSWIVDFYFTKIYSNQMRIANKSIQPNNIIGFYDMFIIYQRIHSSSLIEFFQLCKNKIKQIKNDFILEDYKKYLNRCGLCDIIDLFHQCQLESFVNTITLSINSIRNDIDRLFFEYLLELPSSSWCIYDVQTKLSKTETKENLWKLINNEKKYDVQINSKNYIKHTFCTYLSLLLDTHNEHALIHCLITPARIGIDRETIVELQRLSKFSKNECLTIYQILLSFLRRKELTLNRHSSSQQELTNTADPSFHILDKYYIGIKEFFDFIEQLQMIIEDNEHSKIESITFRQLLELISKQLRKDKSFNRYDLIIKEIIEEFCQCFQTTTLPLINFTSPIRSASSGATLAGRRFLRSIAYLCAKQIINLPVMISNDDRNESLLRRSSSCRSQTTEASVEEKAAHQSIESVFIWQSKTEEQDYTEETRYRRHKSRQLSTIHETSFETDNQTDELPIPDNKTQFQSTAKRQPLREIDINSFNNEERQIENEKSLGQNSVVFTLVSDGDKENLPVTIKKRSMISTKNDPPSKKQKKTNMKAPSVGQTMITSFFQSTS